jgi:hypothetical protein
MSARIAARVTTVPAATPALVEVKAACRELKVKPSAVLMAQARVRAAAPLAASVERTECPAVMVVSGAKTECPGATAVSAATTVCPARRAAIPALLEIPCYRWRRPRHQKSRKVSSAD